MMMIKIIAILVIFIMISSFLCVAAGYSHDCIGEHCKICWQFNLYSNIFNLLVVFAIVCSVFQTDSKHLLEIIKKCRNIIHKNNLVILKVKLSN